MLAFYKEISYNCKCFRDVAQVVERYFREVEVASSSLVIPIYENLGSLDFLGFLYLQRPFHKSISVYQLGRFSNKFSICPDL